MLIDIFLIIRENSGKLTHHNYACNSLTNFYVHEVHSFTGNGNDESMFEKKCEIVSAYGKTLRLQYVQLQGRAIGQLDRTFEDSHR